MRTLAAKPPCGLRPLAPSGCCARRVLVLIASHLGSEFRYTTIKLALTSLAKSTVLPGEVWISYSYNPDLGPPNEDIWRETLTGIKVQFHNRGSKRVQQFDHFRFLSKGVEPDDLVMFLDDDDLYTENKVGLIVKTFKENPKAEVIVHQCRIFGDPFTVTISPGGFCLSGITHHQEYFCFCIKGKKLLEYLESEMPDRPRAHAKCFDDLLFKAWLSPRCDVWLDEALVHVRKDRIPRD